MDNAWAHSRDSGGRRLGWRVKNRRMSQIDQIEFGNIPGLRGPTTDWERLAREAGFRLGAMAWLCSVSERQLERIFKKHLKCTPSRWLRELRCRLAKDLIARGYSSKAAAAELKFATDAHFCREFKKVFGASPQTFAPSRLACMSLAMLGRDGADRAGGV